MGGVLKNSHRITFGSFLAYFLMSAVISPLGVVSGPIAEHFGISVTAATAAFTYLTSGVLAGTVIAVFIFDFVPLKRVVIGGVAVICLCIYAIHAIDSFAVFSIALALTGACCGIELSAGAIVITKTFEANFRASMMLLTDSFYSMAGVISTYLAGVLVARHFHWSSAYLLAFVVSVGIILIALGSTYPATARHEPGRPPAGDGRAWPPGVHCIGVAMCAYLVGFVSIYSWVPNYAQAAFGLDVELSSRLVSRFFLGMFLGQLVMFFLVLRFSLQVLVVLYALMATAMTASLWIVDAAWQLRLAMLVLGLVTGGLFKTVLTYGTTMVEAPSPRMVSYLIFHAGFGTAIAPFASAWIVEQGGMSAALKFATFCYVLMVALILAARSLQMRRAQAVTVQA